MSEVGERYITAAGHGSITARPTRAKIITKWGVTCVSSDLDGPIRPPTDVLAVTLSSSRPGAAETDHTDELLVVGNPVRRGDRADPLRRHAEEAGAQTLVDGGVAASPAPPCRRRRASRAPVQRAGSRSVQPLSGSA